MLQQQDVQFNHQVTHTHTENLTQNIQKKMRNEFKHFTTKENQQNINGSNEGNAGQKSYNPYRKLTAK